MSLRSRVLAGIAAVVLLGGGALAASPVAGDLLGLERAPTPHEAAATDLAEEFLEVYVASDGRVVRHDQGGDTVSEGQAYALLLAVAADDHRTFRRVWRWTQHNLQRPDGLLSWRWAQGQVVDPMPAADADLDTAWALTLAAGRWGEERYAREAARIASAVIEHETAEVGGGRRVLTAGPWAVVDPAIVNPSYASPVALGVLAEAGVLDPSDARALVAGDRKVALELLRDAGYPTDWALVASDGTVTPASGPGERGPGTFGWEAVRVPLRWAASCDDADRQVAARTGAAIERGAGRGELGAHPALSAAAGVGSAAAGQEQEAQQALEGAAADAAEASSYYGDALVALSHVLVHTDRLGGCPPLG